MRIPGWVLAGVAVMALVIAVQGGRRYQASLDKAAADTATARANRAAELAVAAAEARVDSANQRRKAETISRAIAEGEAAILRERAARHARADRQLDSALAVATSAGDSLPIVVEQRDSARAAYVEEKQSGDSVRAVVVSLRRDSVEAVRILQATKVGHAAALEALGAQLRSAAVDLAKAKAERGLHLELGGTIGTIAKVSGGLLAGYFLGRASP